MRSSNPVFARNPEFNGQANPYAQQGYGDPATWGTGMPGQQAPAGRMTIDSVVQKSGLTLGLVIVTAVLTWWWAGDISSDSVSQDQLSRIYTAVMVGTGGAFILSLVNSFKRAVSPALVLVFAALEGIALGGLSKLFDAMFGGGIVSGAVFGTFAAFAGTLAAYKIFDVKVGDKFRKGVMAGMFGMVGLGLLSLVLSLFGVQTPLFGFGAIGLLMSVVGLVLGVFMLILDFDFIEQGIAAGLEERESWRAAFGLTVSLVWIYTNLLRILAFFQQD